MSVDVFCDHSLPLGAWKNIFHVTSGGDVGNIGERFFGLWRNGSSSELHMTINHPTYNYAQKQQSVDFSCTQGEWNTYTLQLTSVTGESGLVAYSVDKDGNVLMSGTYDVSGAYSSGPLYFYVSDPWYDEGSSYLVKNFIYCID